jgi:parallel beta-helix repeat protein
MTSGWWKRRRGGATPPDEPGGRHRSRLVPLALVLAGALGALGGLAPGASAAPTTVSCGSTISGSGTYVLAADCSGVGIEITASDVTLKLNGKTMTGCSSCGSGIFVFDAFGAVSGLTIKGPGTIIGYNAGVQLGVSDFGVSGSSVTGLTVTSNADGILLDGASGNTIRGITAGKNVNAGIHLFQSSNNTVSGNTANHSNADGILLDRGSGGNAVSGNTANNNNGDGIDLVTGATGNTVSGNTAQGNSVFDLFDGNGCGSNTWTGNTFKTANLTCIH